MSKIQLPPLLFTLCLLWADTGSGLDTAQEKPLPGTQDQKPGLEKLLKDLGHKDWKRREEAQKQLIKAGKAALPLLKKYASAADVELARRAHLLRERLDPLISTFHLIEIKLGDKPEIIAQYTGAGKSRRAFKLLGKKSAERKLSNYIVSWDSNDPGKYRVQVRKGASQVTQSAILNTPLTTSPSFSILKLAEEVSYELRGVVTHRERFPMINILHQNHHRLSEARDATREPFSFELVNRLLLEQAHGGDAAERREALGILIELAPPQARTVFLSALKHQETSALGALGLAALGEPSAPGLLVEIIERAASPEPGVSSPREPKNASAFGEASPDYRLDAAISLCRSGDLRGVDYLLRKLTEHDLSSLFRVIATLGDLAPEIARQPELRREFLGVALRADTISQAQWYFYQYEIAYFFRRAIDILDPQDEKDRALAANARDVFEGLVLGKYGTIPINLGTIFPLWKRVYGISSETAGSSEEAGEVEFIEKILPRVASSTGLGFVLERVKSRFAGASIPDPLLELILKNLGRCSDKGEQTLRYAALRGARDLSAAIFLSPGQLKVIVQSLVELYQDKTNAKAGTSLSSTSNLLLPELRRWSGLTLTQSAGAGQKADLTTIRKWLQDDALVSEREKYHLEKQAATGGKKLACYEFLMRIKPRPGSEAAFKLLDGHRHVLEVNHPLNYINRWGERKEIRLSSSGSAARATGSSPPPIYRLNSFNSLSEGIPTFISTLRSDSGIKWYEISRNEPRARYLNKMDSLRDQSLLLVVPLDGKIPEPAAERPSEEADATLETLWGEFLHRHFLKADTNPSPKFRASFLRVQRQLRIPAGLEILKGWHSRSPAVDFAELLHELDDPSGLQYLKKLLDDKNESMRIQAGRSLCSIGEGAGADFLLNLAIDNQSSFARNSYNILASFQKYVEKHGLEDPRTEKILTLILGLIDETRYQSSGFRIIKQAAGQDFGYYSSAASQGSVSGLKNRQPTLAERRKSAIEAARKWWKKRNGTGGGDSKEK